MHRRHRFVAAAALVMLAFASAQAACRDERPRDRDDEDGEDKPSQCSSMATRYASHVVASAEVEGGLFEGMGSAMKECAKLTDCAELHACFTKHDCKWCVAGPGDSTPEFACKGMCPNDEP